jgi:type 2 lantibiotic biosynthesis protein LanM
VARGGAQALWAQFTAGSDNPAAGFRDYDRFVTNLLRSGWSDVWHRYPVLARLAALAVDDWVAATAELVKRVDHDAARLARTFGLRADRIDTVRPGLSDAHDGGRRVSCLHFESGLTVAYKPRDITVEAGWNRLLAWAAAEGLEFAPPAIPVLACEGYGYLAWVESGGLATRAAAERYFLKAGSLLAFADLLRGTDLHGENVIATAEGPVLIDAEALLQPVSAAESQDPHGGRRSCLVTGLLALRHLDAHGRAYEVGGLAPNTPRVATVGRRRWRHLGTNDLAFDIDTSVDPVTANTARLAGLACRPDEFASQIKKGFAGTWEFLAARRSVLLTPGGLLDSLAPARVRVLFRQSDLYGSLLALLTRPRYLESGLERSVALDSINRVFHHSIVRPALWPLVADERRALERHDIPRFTVRASDHALIASDGSRVETHFARSGLDAARTRLAAADDADLAWQLDQIESVLDCASGFPSPVGGRPLPESPTSADVSRPTSKPDTVAPGGTAGGPPTPRKSGNPVRKNPCAPGIAAHGRLIEGR